MITKIEIENYRGYKNAFIFDMSQTKQYGWNKNLIKNGIVNKALIYGPNGAGKSALLLAFMELSSVLTDTERQQTPDAIYFYAGAENRVAKFRFHFLFGKKRIVYEFGKTGWNSISFEKMYVDDVLSLEYSHTDPAHRFCEIAGCGNLSDVQLADNQSFVKFLRVNTIQDENSPIVLITDFAKGMLYFKNLLKGNCYLGFTNGIDSLDSRIIQNGKLDAFEKFLDRFGIHYKLLAARDAFNQLSIGVQFGNHVVPFIAIASSGTRTLQLVYYWSMVFEKATMVLIDEFDAYFHSEAALNLLKMLNKIDNAQMILTTHNTRLFSNDVTRPDCCFVHDGKTIKPVSSISDREFRRADNLERMYREENFEVNKHSAQ